MSLLRPWDSSPREKLCFRRLAVISEISCLLSEQETGVGRRVQREGWEGRNGGVRGVEGKVMGGGRREGVERDGSGG